MNTPANDDDMKKVLCRIDGYALDGKNEKGNDNDESFSSNFAWEEKIENEDEDVHGMKMIEK